jgi:signal peptidase II
VHSLQTEGRTAAATLMLDRRIGYYLIGGGIVLADQVTKHLAQAGLAPGEVVRVGGGDLVWLVLVFNSGIAFGIKAITPLVLAIVAALAAIILAFFFYRNRGLPLLQGLPLALIMGGAVGNLIDRITIGKVVDFISVDTPDFFMTRWPVFNVADSAISVGVVWLVIMSLIGSGAQPEADEDGEDAG